MLAANVPANFPIPFANSAGVGYVRTIPTASQIGITPGAASLTDGFPPLNFLDPTAGGIPPFGQDFNGILKQVTAWSQWQQAGNNFPLYNAAFSAAIGGYPAGAVLMQASHGGLWLSGVDNNTSDPDTGGANWTSFFSSALTGFSLFSSWTQTISQACSAGVFTKIICDSSIFDVLTEYSVSTGIFTPLVTGYYVFNAGVLGTQVSQTARGIYIMKASDNSELGKCYRGSPVVGPICVCGVSEPMYLTAGEGVYMAYKSDLADTVTYESSSVISTRFGGWRLR